MRDRAVHRQQVRRQLRGHRDLRYGSVSFSLIEHRRAGIARDDHGARAGQPVGDRRQPLPEPLQATVLDADGNPVAGRRPSPSASARRRRRRRCERGRELRRRQRAGDRADRRDRRRDLAALHRQRAPPGTFTATATVAGVAEPASFTLDNLAGRPPSITDSARRSRPRPSVPATPGRCRSRCATAAARRCRRERHLRARRERRCRAGSGGAGAAGASFVGGRAQATALDQRARASPPRPG